jgi:hypothetical protein
MRFETGRGMAMAHKHLIIVAGVLTLSAILGRTPGHATSLCTASKQMTIQLDECMKRGLRDMKKRYSRTSQDSSVIYGDRGAYVGQVMCDHVEQGVVFFASAGPDEKVCHRTIDALQDDF